MKFKVVSEKTWQPIGFGMSIVRQLVHAVDGAICYIGYLFPLWDKKRQTIADKIMHGMLETDLGFTLMGADTPPGMEHNPGSAITISLSGDDDDVLRGYWEKLSGGGTVSVPLEKQMWGDEFGACVDQFGVPWMVNIVQRA